MTDRIYTKKIDAADAPERLKGRLITCNVEIGKEMMFSVDLPDDATDAEKDYLLETITAFIDRLRSASPKWTLGEPRVLILK